MKFSKGCRGIHINNHKGGNGGNIQAMGTSRYFIVPQVGFLGLSDNFVEK